MHPTHPGSWQLLPRFLVVAWLCCFLCAAAGAREAAVRSYNLPAADAEKSLKAFSQQSGRGMVVATATVKGVRTNAVRGDFTAHEALNRLLAGTGLVATHDEKSSGFTITRAVEPPPPRRPSRSVSDHARESKKKTTFGIHQTPPR